MDEGLCRQYLLFEGVERGEQHREEQWWPKGTGQAILIPLLLKPALDQDNWRGGCLAILRPVSPEHNGKAEHTGGEPEGKTREQIIAKKREKALRWHMVVAKNQDEEKACYEKTPKRSACFPKVRHWLAHQISMRSMGDRRKV